MILMNEVIKLGGEAKDKIKTATIATARKKDAIITHALAAACYAAWYAAAACCAGATVGEKTKEVTK